MRKPFAYCAACFRSSTGKPGKTNLSLMKKCNICYSSYPSYLSHLMGTSQATLPRGSQLFMGDMRASFTGTKNLCRPPNPALVRAHSWKLPGHNTDLLQATLAPNFPHFFFAVSGSCYSSISPCPQHSWLCNQRWSQEAGRKPNPLCLQPFSGYQKKMQPKT